MMLITTIKALNKTNIVLPYRIRFFFLTYKLLLIQYCQTCRDVTGKINEHLTVGFLKQI